MVEVKGKGKFRGMDAKLYASGGALLALRRADRPYPIKAIFTLVRPGQVSTERCSIPCT
jgi:hypothetical protein